MNVDKRILDELRKECIQIESEGAVDMVDHISELPVEAKMLFDSVIGFAVDDEITQIDTFFAHDQSTVKISPERDRAIKKVITQTCNLKGFRVSTVDLSMAAAAVAFRSSHATSDGKTRKAIADFARELSEEDGDD
jgi:hypothetical protein